MKQPNKDSLQIILNQIQSKSIFITIPKSIHLMKPNQQISKLVAFFICAFSILFILISFFINIPYRSSLFNWSVQAINNIQQRSSGVLVRAFNNIVTIYAGTQGTFFIMTLTYILSYDKINVIVLFMYICANVYIMASLKVIFLDPRPYVAEIVKDLEWKCEPTFGFPSGHTWNLLLLHQPLVTDIIGCGPYKIALMYSIFLAIFVPWSRMYLGSHSADQLLNGLLYSFGFLVLYRYYFRRQIFRLIKSLLSPNKERKKLKYLVLACIHLLFIIPPLILYQINMNFRDIDMSQYYKTKQVCRATFTFQQKMGGQVSDTAIGNIFIAFCYGFLLLPDRYGNDQNSMDCRTFLLGRWQFKVNKFRNYILKKLVLYFVSITLTCGLFYILMGMFIKQFYITYFFKIFTWNSLIIIWIRIIPEVAIRYNLIQEQKTKLIQNYPQEDGQKSIECHQC